MSDCIAFDWEKHQLSGLDADVSKDQVRVRQGFQISWPQELDCNANPEQAAQWLQKELRQLGIRGRQALVSLPRDEVVVRQLEVPDVPDDELPGLVRLQAETKSFSPLDQLVIDFLPLPRPADATARQVLMVTISRKKLVQLRTLFAAAGLKLLEIGISPTATAELVARVERRRGTSPNDTTLVVARHGTRVEISLMRQHHLLFTHSSQLSGDNDQQDNQFIIAELRRSLGALARIDAEIAVSRAWVISTEHETLRKMMTEHLKCDVGLIDPLAERLISGEQSALHKDSARFAGPLGMLLGMNGRLIETIDFLNPREPVIPIDRRKQTMVLVAAGVLTMVALAYGGTKWRVSSLEARIADEQVQLNRVVEAIKQGRPTVDAAGVFDEWEAHNVDWLGQIQRLNQILPGTGRIYLVEYRFRPSSGKTAGRIQADGFARSRRDVEQLYQDLAERNYRVQPHEISRTSDDADYPFRFQLDVDLTREAAPQRRASDAAAPRTGRPSGST